MPEPTAIPARRRYLPALCALGLVIASGVAQVLWGGRGSRSAGAGHHNPAVARVPETVGEWVGQSSTLDRRMLEVGEIDGYLLRHYRNPSGEAVTVMLVYGRPGPISVHTPEVCYGGAGYELAAPLYTIPLPAERSGSSDTFWVADLAKHEGTAPDSLRILYGWSTDGRWRASESPRLDFASSPVLYKVYFIHGSSESNGPAAADPAARFARKFLPELGKALSAGPELADRK